MEQLDIHPRILSALKRAKLKGHETVLSMSTSDLERTTHLSLSDIAHLQKAAAEAVKCFPPATALDIYHKRVPEELMHSYLTTGCDVIDNFLRGGILCPGINEISGESASGKTQICMQLCLTVQLPKDMGGLDSGAVYLCTEDVFPNKRLMQMVDQLKKKLPCDIEKNVQFTDNIFIEHAADLDDMWYCMTKKIPLLLEQGRVKLVIIDSIAALFRCEFGNNEMVKRAKQINSFGAHLQKISAKYCCPVVCVNQVTAQMENTSRDSAKQRKLAPALGISWANLVTVRLMLSRTRHTIPTQQKDISGKVIGVVDACVRTMEVLHAPHLANRVCSFVIDQEGMKGLT